MSEQEKSISLPPPLLNTEGSLESCLHKRRSIRGYKELPLALSDLSQILWAAQGITGAHDFRTAPSAGGTYPLEIYTVVGNVIDLEPGVYHYHHRNHDLTQVALGDKRLALSQGALNQSWVANGAINIVITAFYKRTTNIYGQRGARYVDMEAGHVSQNIYLQCTSLSLGTVAVGAFSDNDVRQVLNIPSDEVPLYIMPIGKPV